jgi:hypothetical protein
LVPVAPSDTSTFPAFILAVKAVLSIAPPAWTEKITSAFNRAVVYKLVG